MRSDTKKKFDDELTSLFKELDAEGRFSEYDLGYHNDGSYDVHVEYTFRKCSIYIPYIWRPTRVGVKREILGLALQRINGGDAPIYGIESLSYLSEQFPTVPDRFYDLVRKKGIGIGPIGNARVFGRYSTGGIDPDCMREIDTKNWGEKIYGAHFKK